MALTLARSAGSRPQRWPAPSSFRSRPSPSGWSGRSARSATRDPVSCTRCRRAAARLSEVLPSCTSSSTRATSPRAARRRAARARPGRRVATSLVARLMPDEAEVLGLLALTRLHLARAEARFAADGVARPAPDQDRARWDHVAIEARSPCLPEPSEWDAPAPTSSRPPSWRPRCGPILGSDRLGDHRHSLRRPVSAPADAGRGLNRALAVAELDGPAAAWRRSSRSRRLAATTCSTRRGPSSFSGWRPGGRGRRIAGAGADRQPAERRLLEASAQGGR